MKSKIHETLFFVLISLAFQPMVFAFEVKGQAISYTFCAEGKCETDKNKDEVIYDVDIKKGIVIRKAVTNASFYNPDLGSGLQSDNTKYQIVYDNPGATTPHRDKTVTTQRIIKAFGQTGANDGFETLVIGEDFIMTSRSSANYFVLWYYRRLSSVNK